MVSFFFRVRTARPAGKTVYMYTKHSHCQGSQHLQVPIKQTLSIWQQHAKYGV